MLTHVYRSWKSLQPPLVNNVHVFVPFANPFGPSWDKPSAGRYIQRRTGDAIGGGSKRSSHSSFDLIASSTWFSCFPISELLIDSTEPCVCSAMPLTVARAVFSSILSSCSGFGLHQAIFYFCRSAAAVKKIATCLW